MAIEMLRGGSGSSLGQAALRGRWRGLGRTLGGALLGALWAGAGWAQPAAPQAGGGEPLRYVMVGEAGAELRNIPDKKGLSVLTIERDTPLAVRGQNGQYLKVEVPGGYRAWVFGQYLRPTSAPGWLEVTGNGVNLRPLPESSNRSYPVDRAGQGDRVREVERQNAALPLSRDWVRVWSPAGSTAWIAAAETRALPAGTDGAALFAAALSAALARDAAPATAAGARPVEASAPVAAAGAGSQAAGGALAALAEAERQNDALAEGSTLEQITAVQQTYAGVLELGPDAATRNIVESRLGVLGLRAELARMREDIDARDAESEARRSELEAQLARQNQRKDPLWGRFQARGWLERSEDAEGQPVFLLRWAGDDRAVIECTSGRYDLAVYQSYEIGVQGFRAPLVTEGALAPERIDVQRIEVISGRLGAGR